MAFGGYSDDGGFMKIFRAAVLMLMLATGVWAQGVLRLPNLYPTSTGTYNLGGATAQWKGLYLSEHITVPKVNIAKVGDTTIFWDWQLFDSATDKYIYLRDSGGVERLRIQTLTSGDGTDVSRWMIVATGIRPNAMSNSYGIGTASYPFESAYISTVYVNYLRGRSDANQLYSKSLAPILAGSDDLGNASSYWNNLYGVRLYINGIAPRTGSTIVFPNNTVLEPDASTSNVYIGGASNPMNAVYTDNLGITTGGTVLVENTPAISSNFSCAGTVNLTIKLGIITAASCN